MFLLIPCHGERGGYAALACGSNSGSSRGFAEFQVPATHAQAAGDFHNNIYSAVLGELRA